MVANSIEREIVIEAPVEVVWGVVTEPEQIVQWFTDTAEIDLRPGGDGVLTWDEKATTAKTTAHMRVQAVEKPHRFSFRWTHPEGAEPNEGNSTLVEFILTAEGEKTRLRVVESGMAGTDWSEEQKADFVRGHSGGWPRHLADLAEFAADRARTASR